MSNEQKAKLIKEKLSEASAYVTDALEKMGNSGKQLRDTYERTIETMESYINQALSPWQNLGDFPGYDLPRNITDKMAENMTARQRAEKRRLEKLRQRAKEKGFNR